MIIRRSSFLAVMFGAAVFANVPAAQAAITKTHQAQASALMQQGKAAQAYALLRRHHNRASAGPQQWFILGLAAYRARDLNAAEYAFRQVLAKRPNAPRAKLELARVLQQKGDAKNAERLFREVRALNPPARVAANIDRFIALLQNRNQKGHAFRARATVGVGYDSNVNQATRARTVTLFGLPFMLGSDARKKGAVFGFFTGEFDHVYRANRQFAWVTNLSFTARRHLSHKDFDSFTINAATGPVFQPGDRTTFLLPVFVKVSRYENSALPASRRFYSNEFGIAPQLNHALNKMFTLKLAAVFSHRHYFEQQARNTRIIRGSAGFDIKAGPRSVISAGLVAGREAARHSLFIPIARMVLL